MGFNPSEKEEEYILRQVNLPGFSGDFVPWVPPKPSCPSRSCKAYPIRPAGYRGSVRRVAGFLFMFNKLNGIRVVN